MNAKQKAALPYALFEFVGAVLMLGVTALVYWIAGPILALIPAGVVILGLVLGSRMLYDILRLKNESEIVSQDNSRG